MVTMEGKEEHPVIKQEAERGERHTKLMKEE